ncbi:MAG: hypothetical protein WCA29_02455 [Jiangellales bacterium]
MASGGELPATLERRACNQPAGLHITALLALTLAVAMPVSSISAMASAIFLVVFGVVNAAEFRTDPSGAARAVAAVGALGCAVSLVVLVGESLRTDSVAVAVLAALMAAALAGEHAVLKSRRPGHVRLSTAQDASR